MTTPTGNTPTFTPEKPTSHLLGCNLAQLTPTTESALRAILLEVTPGQRPYSTDSYLPDHLVKAAQSALNGTDLAQRQHAYNALSTAAWHIARGEAPQALARIRRAASHIKAGGAA